MVNGSRGNQYEPIAWAIGVPLGILAAGYGLGKWIWPALVSTGATYKMAVAGIATASWMPAAGAAIAVTVTLSVSVYSVKKIADDAPKRPFVWCAALFGAISPFIVDFCKEFYIDTQDRLLKTIFKGIVVVTFLIAAVFWGEKKTLKDVPKREILFRRTLAVLAYLIIPTLILLRSWHDVGHISQISLTTWLAIAALIAMFMILVLLQRLFTSEA